MVDSVMKDDVLSLCAKADVSASGYKRFSSMNQWSAAEAPQPVLVTTAVEPLPEPPVGVSPTFPIAQLAANQPASFFPTATAQERPLSSLCKVFEQTREAAARPRQRTQTAVCPVLAATGGCGTTTVLATLGRVLSILGENVLLVESTGSQTLPLYFGGEPTERGLLRYQSQTNPFEGAVHVFLPESDDEGPVYRSIAQLSGEVQHVFLAPSERLRERMGNRLWVDGSCLVVITPELRSVLAVDRILRTLDSQTKAHFLLNRFNADKPLHMLTREKLHAQLGDSLLPLTLPESDEVENALASGLTVLDSAPKSKISDAYFQLAGWLRNAQAGTSR